MEPRLKQGSPTDRQAGRQTDRQTDKDGNAVLPSMHL